MKFQDLRTMFIYLRRAFTTQDSKELLTKFFPSDEDKIKEITMSDTTTTGLTKMAQARLIYEAAEDKSRKNIIRLFQEQIPAMAQTTASTYYYQMTPGREKRVPKVETAREIYANAEQKTRKNLVPKFMALGMTENVASTYFYNCKKHFAALAEAEATAI